jgi:hypothetical protein
MSHKLISHNQDLKKLRDEGYEVEIKNAHLLVHSVPYVNTRTEIARGTLVSPLGDMAGDKTTKPSDHVIHFAGEHPCNKDGSILRGIQHSSGRKTLADGVDVDHSFSNKPQGGYSDYHEKVTMYVRIIEAPAQAIDPTATARTFKPIESSDPATPFRYLDTNSSRAEIEAISMKFMGLKIAIVGLGGTGSYVLDMVAKTPVAEIHLFDKDNFLSHNAFRSPGAASIDELNSQPTKVAYLYDKYSKIHNNVIPHEYYLSEETLAELESNHFVFVCIDESTIKKALVQKLIESHIPFVDVGIGINVIDDKLGGGVRVTTVTSEKNNHVSKYVSFSDGKEDDYSKNIQIAELNALNAALAVIKWKKTIGFYHDQEHEYNAVYDINVNKIINNETDA